MKQQTAVDFFLMRLVDLEIGKTFYPNQHQDLQDAFKQAKAMEKEQIMDAYCKGDDNIGAEQYYKETYGGKDL